MALAEIVNNTIVIEQNGAKRYLVSDNIVMFSLLKGKFGDYKIAVNFENTVQSNELGKLVPDFQYIFGDKEDVTAAFSELCKKLEKKRFISLQSINGPKLVNLGKINSFLVDGEDLYVNMNSSISSPENDQVIALSTKCFIKDNKDKIQELCERI